MIDTGARSSHEDLAPVIQDGWNPTYQAGVYQTPDMPGFKNYSDADAHGTHTAGSVGAAGNNGKGITGVAWGVNL